MCIATDFSANIMHLLSFLFFLTVGISNILFPFFLKSYKKNMKQILIASLVFFIFSGVVIFGTSPRVC